MAAREIFGATAELGSWVTAARTRQFIVDTGHVGAALADPELPARGSAHPYNGLYPPFPPVFAWRYEVEQLSHEYCLVTVRYYPTEWEQPWFPTTGKTTGKKTTTEAPPPKTTTEAPPPKTTTEAPPPTTTATTTTSATTTAGGTEFAHPCCPPPQAAHWRMQVSFTGQEDFLCIHHPESYTCTWNTAEGLWLYQTASVRVSLGCVYGGQGSYIWEARYDRFLPEQEACACLWQDSFPDSGPCDAGSIAAWNGDCYFEGKGPAVSWVGL